MHKIYALFDAQLHEREGLSFEEFVLKIVEKKATYLQYRDKVNPQDIKIQNLKKLRKLYTGVLLINDDISLVSYCDGLHVGQEDIAKFSDDKKDAVSKIREQIGDKVLGLSTHNIEEVKEANSLEIDYIGLGAYRDSSTKEVSNVLGDKLSHIASYSKHKVAAIGGVKFDDKIKHVEFLVLGSNIYED
jgi:thiamine-phosphate pyrophosphorylase